MSPVVFAVPYVPPTPPAPPFRGFGLVWVGWDGSEWDMTGTSGPTGLSLLPGVRGIDTPPPTRRQTKSSPAVAGTRHQGTSVLERPVYWPLRVFSDESSQAWIEYDRAFWATLDEDRVGTWRITHPDGTRRELVCRYDSTDNQGSDIDPALAGWNTYGINLVAEQPYWTGKPVVVQFEANEPTEFFSTDPDTVVHISEGSTLEGAQLHNPGDVTTAPTWWISGTESLTVGVGDVTLDVPFEVAEDRLLVVDSAQTAQTAKEVDAPPPGLTDAEQVAWVAARLPTADDRTKELGTDTGWASIPARNAVDLALAMIGDGRVQARLVPQYRRGL